MSPSTSPPILMPTVAQAEEKRRADKRREAHLIFAKAIRESGSVQELEVLRMDVRAEQAELGMGRRVTLEQDCSRRIKQLAKQGRLFSEAA